MAAKSKGKATKPKPLKPSSSVPLATSSINSFGRYGEAGTFMSPTSTRKTEDPKPIIPPFIVNREAGK